jgi:hypothetical protein
VRNIKGMYHLGYFDVDGKIDLESTGCEDVDWINLAQDNIRVPEKAENFLKS